MSSNDLIYENSALLYFEDGNRYYENSPRGRESLLHDCKSLSRMDLYNGVMAVWGEAPSVEDEREKTLDDFKEEKKAEIAAARYASETAGTTVNGIMIDTGRDSQALITGAALAAMLDSEYSLNWKTASGFIHLSAPEIIAVAQAVRAHVQACFDREAELCALVDAAETAEDLDEIVISWPV